MEIDKFWNDNLQVALKNAEKNEKKTGCNLSANFATTYSGETIPQSKEPNSTNTEDKATRLVSNDRAGRSEEDILSIKTFVGVDQEKSVKKHIAIFEKSVWENQGLKLVTLFLFQNGGTFPSGGQIFRGYIPPREKIL